MKLNEVDVLRCLHGRHRKPDQKTLFPVQDERNRNMGDYTAARRQKEWRERQREQGKRTLTVTIDQTLIERMKSEAKKREETMSELVEQAFSHFLGSDYPNKPPND